MFQVFLIYICSCTCLFSAIKSHQTLSIKLIAVNPWGRLSAGSEVILPGFKHPIVHAVESV